MLAEREQDLQIQRNKLHRLRGLVLKGAYAQKLLERADYYHEGLFALSSDTGSLILEQVLRPPGR